MTGTDLTPEPSRSNALIAGLEWIYDRVSETVPPGTGNGTDDEIDTWIRLACTGAGTAGFVANLGGAITLPVALPANLLSTATIQLTLVAKIAAARGYDIASPEVRTFAIACLVGAKAMEIVGDAGVMFGMKLAQAAINQIAGATLAKINQAVGFRLLTKAGQQGVVNLTKLVPIVGGFVGGGIDAMSTLAVGNVAKRMFPRTNKSPPSGGEEPVGPALNPSTPSVAEGV